MPIDDAATEALRKAYVAGDLQAFNQILAAAQRPAQGAVAPGQVPAMPAGPDLQVPMEPPAAPAPVPQARPGGFTTFERVMGPTLAGIHSFTNTATAGLSDALQARVGALLEGDTPQAQQAKLDAQMARYRAAGGTVGTVLDAAGTVGGLATGGGLLSAASKSVPALARALPQIGEGALSSIGKLAGTGAAVGAAPALVRGDDSGSALTGAAVGGLAGPVGAAAGQLLARGTQRVLDTAGGTVGTSRAWRYLASKLGMTPQDAALLARSAKEAGGNASLQSVLTTAQQDVIRRTAAVNPTMASIQSDALRAGEQALPGQVAGVVRDSVQRMPLPAFLKGLDATALSPNAVAAQLKQSADKAFGALRNTPVKLPDELIGMPELYAAVPGARNRLLRERIANNKLTGGDVDMIRQALSRQATIPGSDAAQLRDALVQGAASLNPAYSKALGDFAQGAKFRDAFSFGWGGGMKGNVTDAQNASLFRTLQTPEGTAAYELGRAGNMQQTAAGSVSGARTVMEDVARTGPLTQATGAAFGSDADVFRTRITDMLRQDIANRRATPSSSRPAIDSTATGHLIFGATEIAGGMPRGGAFRIAHGIVRSLGGAGFSKKAQQEIGKGLTAKDAATRQATAQALLDAMSEVQRRTSLSTAAGLTAAGQAGSAAGQLDGGAQ